MPSNTVSVLIIDDSALMRNLIGRIIDGEEGLSVAGKAMNGKFALQKLDRLNPDVIILDLEMPEMNGIEFLKERKRRGIDIPVVILSSIARKGAKITMEALSLGASDFIMKPSGPVSEDIKTIGRHLTDAVRAYGLNYQKKRGVVITETPAPQTQARRRAVEADTAVALGEKEKAAERPIGPLTEVPERKAAPIEIVAIGISTGGPNALREVFSQIQADMPVPIVVVQHMPAGFTEEFAKSLDKVSPLEISEAKDGDVIKPGRVLIAPGNYHMEIEKKRLAPVVTINSNPPVNGHRPSVDVLFSSIAKNYGGRSLAVIMTGMGKDGAREIGEIRKAGGITIAQDQKSCVVFGMPKVAYDNGFIQHLVPLKEISGLIGKIIKENS